MQVMMAESHLVVLTRMQSILFAEKSMIRISFYLEIKKEIELEIVNLPIYGGYAAEVAYELIGSLGGTAEVSECCCDADACCDFCDRMSAVECPALLLLLLLVVVPPLPPA